MNEKFKILIIGQSIKNFTQDQILTVQLVHYPLQSSTYVPVTEEFSYEIKLQQPESTATITVENPNIEQETIIKVSGVFPNMQEYSTNMSKVLLYMNEVLEFNYFDNDQVMILSQSPNLFQHINIDRTNKTIEPVLSSNVSQSTEFYFEFRAKLNSHRAGLL